MVYNKWCDDVIIIHCPNEGREAKESLVCVEVIEQDNLIVMGNSEKQRFIGSSVFGIEVST